LTNTYGLEEREENDQNGGNLVPVPKSKPYQIRKDGLEADLKPIAETSERSILVSE
jgi:hypothetical protein